MSRGLMIIPTCHPDALNLFRLTGMAREVGLRPHVVWQGGGQLEFETSCVPGSFWPEPLGKGAAVKVAHSESHFPGTLDEPWLVVDGDLRSIDVEALRAALTLAAMGYWVRGRFDTYGRLTGPVAALLESLGYGPAGHRDTRRTAHLWTSGVQAYPAGAMTRDELNTLPDGYGWDVRAAYLMHLRHPLPCAPVVCGPRHHRETDGAHLARVLGEVAVALGEVAPAWSE